MKSDANSGDGALGGSETYDTYQSDTGKVRDLRRVDPNRDFSGSPAPSGRTLAQLIGEYKSDRVSGYSKLRYHTRKNHDNLLDRMVETYGHWQVADIRARTLEEMYLTWSKDGTKIAMAHMFLSKLRTLCGYGAGMLEDMECNRICIALNKRKDPQAQKAKETFLTAEQATAIREMARRVGYFSIALTQAFQFDCVLRQRDCLGETVPATEPVESDYVWDGKKWFRGIRWEEIDSDLVLRHVTSKRQKKLVVPLALCPMVKEELDLTPSWIKTGRGPIIISEITGRPWEPHEFRRKWRDIADLCGVPKEVKNMDSRSGGISEGTSAGIPLELMRHAATHSDIQTTMRYSRNSDEKVAESLRQRVAFRNKQQDDTDPAVGAPE